MSLPSNVETSTSTPLDCWRNRVAGRLANAVLRLATPTYRDFIEGAIRYGMNAAARDLTEGSEPPPAWFEEQK